MIEMNRTNQGTRPRIPGMLTIPIQRDEGGYVAQGPGFYVWDEDPNEVVRVTNELQRGNLDVAPSRRFLLMRDAFAPAVG
jgi:hypothetical protein